MIALYPSLMGADLLNLQKEITNLDPYCAGFHIDVMDNHFVPNLTMGPAFIQAIDQVSNHPLWVHMMVENPGSLIRSIIMKSKSLISFHIETKKDISDIIKFITEKNFIPGLAINPKTPVEELYPFIDVRIGSIVLMTVEPGFCGQVLIPAVLAKIQPLVDFRQEHNLSFSLALDGGINQETMATVARYPVDAVAVASGIFSFPDRVEACKKLMRTAQEVRSR